VSKERARRREERELAAAHRQSALQAERERAAARARRRARFRLPGRRRTAQVDARVRERRATIGSLLLVVVVVTYLATRSLPIVIGVLLVAAVALPALVTTLFGRNSR